MGVMEHRGALPPRVQLSNIIHEIFIEINRLVRGYLSTTLFNIGDQQSKAAISANMENIAQKLREVFNQYDSDYISDRVKADFLNFMDHIEQLVDAYANRDENSVIRIRNELYYLANIFARNLSVISRYFSREALQTLLYGYINSIENQIVSILNQDYAKDIEEYGVMNEIGYRLADEITYGILRQFYSEETQ
jgi:hypothetical protein